MSAKKIVTVFGATGVQGGSVIKSILADPKASSQFALRGITRDVSKASSKALAEKGVEVVAADISDRAALSAAIKGSYAVFAVTNYWDKMDKDLEESQGRTIAELAKEHGIQHYIWSTLKNISETSGGKLTEVHHFDAKSRVDGYIKELGLPATFYLPGLYMSNFPGSSIRKNGETGVYELGLPIKGETKLALLATEYDTGKFIKSILLNRSATLGKEIYGAEKYYTLNEIIKIFEEVKPVDGKGAKYIEVSSEAYKAGLAKAGMPPFIQEELVQNWQLNEFPGYYSGEGLEEGQKYLDEQLMGFKEYLQQNAKIADLK